MEPARIITDRIGTRCLVALRRCGEPDWHVITWHPENVGGLLFGLLAWWENGLCSWEELEKCEAKALEVTREETTTQGRR